MPSSELFAGRYRIERSLGQGAFGQVFKATDTAVKQSVALKVYSHAPDETVRAAFLREAKAQQHLTHRNIVRLLEVGEDGGRRYLAYEFVEGSDLHGVLRKGPLSLENALAVLSSVSQALDAAHAQGLVHRDIKPSNVLLPRQGAGFAFAEAKLTDFGLVGRLEGSTATTRAGMIFGTVTYMSPEQARGEKQSAATDTWGLGALFFEMVYGQVPFRADSLHATLYKIISEEVQLPAEPVVPDDVAAFLRACLAKSPADRPREPTSEIERLRVARRGGSETASPAATDVLADAPPVRASRAPSPAPPIAPTTTGAMPIPTITRPLPTAGARGRPRRGRPWIVGIAGGGALVAVAALLVRSLPGRAALGVLLGLSVVVAGVLVGLGLRKVLAHRRTAIEREAGELLLGAKGRDALTRSIAIELDTLVARCREVDARILATSVALMVEEYITSAEGKDRQAALMNAVQLLEKLMTRLSPWYVRYEKLLAAAVALVGLVSGLAKVVESLSQARTPIS